MLVPISEENKRHGVKTQTVSLHEFRRINAFLEINMDRTSVVPSLTVRLIRRYNTDVPASDHRSVKE